MWVVIFNSNIKFISLLLYTLSKPHINFLGIVQMDISIDNRLIRAKYFNLSRLFKNKQYKRAKAPFSYLLQNLSCKEHFVFYFGLKVSLSCSLQLDKKKIECHITITWYIDFFFYLADHYFHFISLSSSSLHQQSSQHCLFGFVKQVSSLLGSCSFPHALFPKHSALFSKMDTHTHAHRVSHTVNICPYLQSSGSVGAECCLDSVGGAGGGGF